MRKSLLALILLGGVFFTLGAAPSVASAANCSFGQNTTYKGQGPFVPSPPYAAIASNRVWSALTIYNCTDVSAVRWKWITPGGPRSGWFDYSACWCFAQTQWLTGYPGATWNTGDQTQNNPGGGVNTRYVDQVIWWSGHCRVVGAYWAAQIKNAGEETWGTITTFSGPTVNICN